MIDGYPRALTIVAVVGTGLMAGVFFVFSTFVMQALRRLPDAEGLTAMQAINKSAPSPMFMLLLFGSTLVCLALVVSTLTRLNQPSARYQLVGGALYIVSVVLTAAYHVPKNDALARVSPASAGAVGAWRHYATTWTAWNHVRTVTSLAAAVVLALALRAE